MNEVEIVRHRQVEGLSLFINTVELRTPHSHPEWELIWLLEELTEYNDGGMNLPNIYIVLGKRIVDLSGMQSGEQIVSLGSVELAGCGNDELLIVAATKRVDA